MSLHSGRVASRALVGLLLLAAVLAGCGTADPKSRATDACRQFVQDRLKAPSTAKFAGLAARKADPYYIVEGSVEAQNALGVPLKSSFSCTVEPQGKSADDKWKLLGIQGLD
jgi:hypothetical protein